MEKMEFGLGFQRREEFEKATKKKKRGIPDQGSIPGNPKGWEVTVTSRGTPATSQLLLCITHVISATPGWRPESPLLGMETEGPVPIGCNGAV